ncbi:hypothetical protein Pcinc_016964 [Petrolisthes cinctipes]|uniref:Uncharacterized protein n=1 Tax=Petrolisthes cinctipes TaxID=88211 RepID=A0AAE1KQE3_PETCI|nr:hypothetical protein Pcinc_016964 [Petrolisthes cinctipes]
MLTSQQEVMSGAPEFLLVIPDCYSLRVRRLSAPLSSELQACNMSTKNKGTFRDAWLEVPEFQPWLGRMDGDNTKAYCRTCKRAVGAEITTLRRHKKTKLHTKN